MASKKNAAPAEDTGWVTTLEQPPQTVTATGTGANTEVVVRAGKYVAEKTLDGHLITAVGETPEALAAAIEAQQASIDSAPATAGTDRAAVSDQAGGEEGGGIATALPETEVAPPEEVPA